MKKDFLNYYNNELYYIREAAVEFARANPQIAPQLGLEGFKCVDPHIERLLEGFAYLAARVHLRLDSDFSKFSQAVINSVYPDYLIPFPSASIVHFEPAFNNEEIIKGVKIPKGSRLNTIYRSSTGTKCTFETSTEVTVWPVKISNALYSAKEVPSASSLGINESPKAYLSIELKTAQAVKFCDLENLDHLDFHITNASNKVLIDIYEQIFTDLLTVLIEFQDKDGIKYRIKLNDMEKQVLPLGLDEDQSLLPFNLRASHGYRLLKEYFTFPKKFMFFRLSKLRDALTQIQSDKIEIIFIMKNVEPLLETSVNSSNFLLYAAPVINVFKKRLDRLSVSVNKPELKINADNSKPYDYEILSIDSLEGYDSRNNKTLNVKPFYEVSEYDKYNEEQSFYYSIRRNVNTDNDFKYGSDVFLSLTNAHCLDNQQLSELSITALCSNRNTPPEIPVSQGKTDFTTESHYPIKGVKLLERPTEPNYSNLTSLSDWNIINHLKVNYRDILDNDIKKNTEVIKELLKLYACSSSTQNRKQIEGLDYLKIGKEMMYLESSHGVSFGSGVQLEMGFDENAYRDSGFYILSTIISKVISNNIPINTLMETSIVSNERGEIKKWITMP